MPCLTCRSSHAIQARAGQCGAPDLQSGQEARSAQSVYQGPEAVFCSFSLVDHCGFISDLLRCGSYSAVVRKNFFSSGPLGASTTVVVKCSHSPCLVWQFPLRLLAARWRPRLRSRLLPPALPQTLARARPRAQAAAATARPPRPQRPLARSQQVWSPVSRIVGGSLCVQFVWCMHRPRRGHCSSQQRRPFAWYCHSKR